MYKKFFNLNEDPFNVSPDPRFLYSTAEIEEAFAHVLSGIRYRKGVILLTGEVGTGKTILLKKLMDKLRGESTASAFVFNPRLNPTEFFDYVLSDFGLNHDSTNKLRMLQILHKWILDRHQLGKTTALIIDEAQDLPTEVFEEIRLLSNLETPTDKLLQIILSGQPEIEEILHQPGLRSFSQRIMLRRRTHALTLADASHYIAHRLRVAGGDIWTIFSPEAVASVYRFSQGIPRVINLLGHHALISSYADEQKPVRGEIIEEVAREFGLVANALPYQPLLDEAVKSFKSDSLAHPPAKNREGILSPTSPTTMAPPLREMPEPVEDGMPMWIPSEEPLISERVVTAEQISPPPLTETGLPQPSPREFPEPAVEHAPPVSSEQDILISQPVENADEVPSLTQAVTVVPLPPPGKVPKPTEEIVPTPMSVEARPAPQPPEIGKRIPPPTPAVTKAPSPPLKEAPKLTVDVVRTPISGEEPPIPRPMGSTDRVQPSASRTAKDAPPPLQEARKPSAELNAARDSTKAKPVLKQEPVKGASPTPVIRKTAFVATASPSEATRPTDRQARALRPPKKQSAVPDSPALGVPAGLKTERPKTLEWAFLALITMGVVVGGYYLENGNRLIATREDQTPASESRPAGSNDSPARVAPVSETPKPSDATGEMSQNTNEVRPPPTSETAREATPTITPRASARVVQNNPASSNGQELERSVAPAEPAPPPAGQIFVTSNVLGASITLDGRRDPSWTIPHTFTGLSPGPHSVVVSREGYSETRRSVSVEAGKEAAVNLTLSAPSGEINIVTNPSADGQQPGRESVSGNLAVQDRAVVTRTIELPLSAPPSPATNVAVDTDPPKATVYADGAPMPGGTPLSFHLPPGHHTLIIFTTGYRPVRREIEVPVNGTLAVKIPLPRL